MTDTHRTEPYALNRSVKAFSITVASLFAASTALARIGDSPAQLRERFGEPTASSFDQQGYGIALYHSAAFKEIRVTFAAGRSQRETYLVADDAVPGEPFVAALEKENPGHFAFESASLGIIVGEGEPEGELKFVTHSGEQKSYTGILQLKRVADRQIASLHAEEAVVEIPADEDAPEFANLQTGMKCTVTVLDKHSDDLYAPIAIVGAASTWTGTTASTMRMTASNV